MDCNNNNIGEEEVKAENEKEAPVKARGPLVLQCQRCWRILGDSWAFESSDPVANTISLRAVSNIRMVDDPVVSGNECENGSSSSSNMKLECVGCNSVVGRVVMTATQQNLKNTLRGDLHVSATSPSPKQSTPFHNDTATASSSSSENVWTEIEKIEKVILALNDRLQHLEKLNGVTLKHRGNGDGA